MSLTTIIYLSEDFPYSKIHHELCRNIILSNSNVDVVVYSVLRKWAKGAKSPFYPNMNYKTLIYDFDGSDLRYKYDFFYKVRKKYNWLVRHADLSQVSKLHASTLFSDGAVALKLYKQKGIPYIVSVRATDVNLYFKYMFYLWPLGIEILKNAQNVCFITENGYNSLIKFSYFNIKSIIDDKKMIFPNGVDQFWIENSCNKKDVVNPCNILFVGKFDKNKNVVTLMHSVLNLTKSKPDLCMTLVGGGGSQSKEVYRLCKKYPKIFIYRGKISDKEELCKVIRSNHVLAMASHSETFGLVYLEALSRGLPVLYSKGQGIDGVFRNNIGEAVDSKSIKSVELGLQKLLKHYSEYEIIGEIIKNFSWQVIAKSYIELYFK